MTTLILTEKPSVAVDFSKALGVRTKRDGYFEGNDTLICWAVGHLVELFAPEDYSPSFKKWSLDTLPILPEPFKYKPIKKSGKQLSVIKKLLKTPGLSRVIIATDAGREGEVIARTILLQAGFTDKGRIMRFWTSQALTPAVVRSTLNKLKPITDYDRLWRAGYYRQVADWMVGMNGTRALTVRLGDLYSVGRVQTAVLALLVQRRRERENFKPEPYLLIKVHFQNEKGTWIGTWFKGKETRLFDLETARALVERLTGDNAPGTVLSAEKEKKSEPPPFLFSLTDLQQEANKRFGFPAKKTLSVAQGLYQDKKCLSYPRTDSRVLGTQNLDMVKKLVEKLAPSAPALFEGVDHGRISLSNKRVFNDAKLTDHHALIPLKNLPPSASADEAKIFELVLRRFAAAFHPNCHYENTKIVTGFSQETFQTTGKIILSPGWRAAWPVKAKKEEEAHIPPLAKGDPAHKQKVAPEKKETTPPPAYTDALILKEMTNPGRYVSEKAMKDLFRGEIGIGTQSTRAQILEILITREYAKREGKTLNATDKGCYLVEMLQKTAVSKVLTSPEETARWEMSLNRIALGENDGSNDTFLAAIKGFVEKSMEELKTLAMEGKAPASRKKTGEVVGRCPACGGEVIEAYKNYTCTCGFTIWKKMAGKTLTPNMVGHLLRTKKSGPYNGFLSKKKKRFSAAIVLVQKEGTWQTTFDFDSKPKKSGKKNDGPVPWASERPASESNQAQPPAPRTPRPDAPQKPLPPCPACGGTIIEGKRGFGCANWPADKGGCRFVIWKTLFGRELTRTQLISLLSMKPTRPCNLTRPDGQPVKTRIRLTNTPQGWVAMADPDEQGYHHFQAVACSHG
ncbi:DNA topoisomerase III [Desulfoluna butyratoxydans]|uniref:DNA topoisomerase n=1 Tax=Desulfoluna butyratoxydans TaxID=231438 RepID=A0A4U8YX12_9BACT|nr:DNA topoisomerase III [Desulfoluna butyratoxydans]VFQ45973.1 dna topoisomerase iii [Desulfoluna butyratoxydans]